MVIYELLFIIIMIWLVVFVITKDLFSPTSLLCMSYILAVVCAIYNIENWQIDLHYNTVGIIVLGILCFAIFEVFYIFLHSRKSKFTNKSKINDEEKIKYLEIPKNKITLLNFINFVIFVIYLYFFLKALNLSGSNLSFSGAMQRYRSLTMFKNVQMIPTLVNFLIKYCRALAFIVTYVIINNFIITGKMQIKREYLWSILIYIPITLMSGGRYDLIVYILYMIVLWSILNRLKNGNIDFSKIVKISLIIIIVLILFANIKFLVGRQEKMDTIGYITQYFGGSIQIFDMYMQEIYKPSESFGQETFASLRKFLNQIGFLEELNNSDTARIFRKAPDGTVIGNVYTGFRKMYQDFGVFGLILLQSLLSLIYCKLYYSSLRIERIENVSYKIMVYSTISFCIILHSFSEVFYSTVISFNYGILFLMMYFIIKFIFAYKL